MQVQSHIRQVVALVLAAVFLVGAGGCLITSRSKTQESGVRISEVTLDQIRPGETTEAWLVAAAGNPTSRRVVDQHMSILRYDHVVSTSRGGTVFLLFAGGSKKEKSSSVIFEIADGVVSRYWTEASS